MTTVRHSQILRATLLLLVTAVLCQFAYGEVIHVDDDAAGANNGTNWENAYVYLQDALVDANDSAKPVDIRVAQGTYTPDRGDGYVPGDKQAIFLLKGGVTLKGGFAGVGTDDPNAWDNQAYKTVLSGDLSGNDDRWLPNFIENSDRVIGCTQADGTAVLDGFTITGGYATDSRGGGMYNIGASPTVRRCVFFDNYASSGGGMANLGGSPTVTECTFSGNLANMGGGMFNYESHPIVESCVFYDNGTNMLGGGGMHNYVDSNSTVINCLFIDNRAPFGAGMYNYYADTTIINCTFSNNRANGWGGGIHSEVVGHTVVTNCIVWGNTPDQIIAMAGGWGRSFAVDVTYSDVQDGYSGEGNIDVYPIFANPSVGDYHLKSQAGRWDQASQRWVFDYVTSPCIDAGDPNSSVASEPFPDGAIINMGAYGGTTGASKSPFSPQAKYSGGTGGPNDPYQIATAEDLMLLGDSPRDYYRHFILTADIDLDPSLPGRRIFDRAIIAPDTEDAVYGYQGTLFTGVFDGNGLTISHLTITGGSCLGLFGQLHSDAIISNLGVEAVDVSGTGNYAGGLVGSNGDWVSTGGILANCYSTGAVSGADDVGGLVGHNSGNVANCYSSGSVSGRGFIGGLIGRNSADLANCYSSGSVSGDSSVGGLVGICRGTIVNCFSSASVSVLDICGGGLIGNNETNGTVMGCYTTGQVSGRSSTGGLVGENHGTIYDCYSTAQASATKGGAGGLVAFNYGAIQNCYSTGRVSAPGYVGGLVGAVHGEGSVTNSFWNVQTSGQPTSTAGTGKTSAEMQTAGTFLDADWDFVGETANGTEDIWWILEGQDYPRLVRKLSAYSPDPPDGAMDIMPLIILRWIPGASALYHDVYLGEDEQAVANATVDSPGIYRERQLAGMTTYNPGILGLAKTYYWRIDEVNEADTNSPWKGNVWSFTTAGVIVVDDL